MPTRSGTPVPTNDEDLEYITVVDGVEIVLKKCRTCNLIRPPRSFHCSDCQACIEVHDHHCPWVGTCVGKRNHRYFLLFLIMTTVHSIYTILLDVFFLKEKYYENNGEVNNEDGSFEWNTPHIISIVMCGYTSLITCCVGCLSSYHGKLACENVTTNEEIRGKFENGNVNPYDQGCSGNCRSFWFGGVSRVYADNYNIEALSKTEPNVFII